ncbi:unnamed protein product [Allacma fusca]|uniref:Peptidase M12A domain-containing protein n=1 Tax=Allacma fusca TaxID=39272 RepID=A0A8J2P5G8_9HEXA|nr:unnamed protein product [Allacma fusca]
MLRLTVFTVFLALSSALPAGHRDVRTLKDKNLLVDDIKFPSGWDINSGLIGDQYRWPNRELIYVIDNAFDAGERGIVEAAMNEISSKTCIRFRQRSNENDYVFIQKGEVNSGCWSYVGKIGGQQVLNLQRPEFEGAGHCIWVGTAAHEMIHAIGFYHEQSRYDRDDFVEMDWSNIPQEYHYAFDKYPSSMVDTFGVPYDYSSIMHYDAYAFAIDGRKPTIIPKQPGAKLGNDQLTDYDTQKINRMYNC